MVVLTCCTTLAAVTLAADAAAADAGDAAVAGGLSKGFEALTVLLLGVAC